MPTPPSPQRVTRVTDEHDGILVNRAYSYWPNAYIRGETIDVFIGHVDDVPRLFRVTRATGSIERRHWPHPYRGATEGWYWDATGWILLLDGPRLRRVHPHTAADDLVFDISRAFPDCRLWQAHSSADGYTHSATLERPTPAGPFERLGTIVYRHGSLQYFAALGTLDESQIDASGQWLVIKEGEDNRILNLSTGTEQRIADADGAVGHSDLGDGILVGEDNIHGQCIHWDLATLTRRNLFQTWNMGHLSIQGGRCLLSNQTQLALVDLETGALTPVLDHGMTGDGYDFQVRANLDPTGHVACFLSNRAGRLDVYLRELP